MGTCSHHRICALLILFDVVVSLRAVEKAYGIITNVHPMFI